MRSLVSYIEESLEQPTFFRLSLNGINGYKRVVDEIIKSSILDGYKAEKTDDGVRVLFSKENINKAQIVINKINDFIADIPSEDHTRIAKTLAKLVAQVENLQSIVNEYKGKTEEE